MTETYVRARVLLLFGDEAHVAIPERDYWDPVRLPAVEIAEASGLDVHDLPGRTFEVVFSGTPDAPVLSGWRAL